MSTRKRNTASKSNLAPNSDLPSSRKGKATAKHKTNLPLSRISFGSFIYILAALALCFIGFQTWRLVQLKSAAGGWWNLALGRQPPTGNNDAPVNYDPGNGKEKVVEKARERESVEDRINALAEALGLPSSDLASAIADAVKSHVPPASLSSVAAAEATKKGTLAGILTGEEDAQQPGTGFADRLGAVAGFDDPVGAD